MDKKVHKKWVNKYLNEDSDWESVMCDAEAKATALFFGRNEKRKLSDGFVGPAKRIKIEGESFKKQSSAMESKGISSSLESLTIIQFEEKKNRR